MVKRNQRGITLIALVITIIILLVISAVAISLITGQDGFFAKSNNSRVKYTDSSQEEADKLNNLVSLSDAYIQANRGNDDYSTEGTNNSNYTSTVIGDFTPVIVSKAATVIAISNNLSNNDRDNVLGYAYFINGIGVEFSKNATVTISGLTASTEYSITIIAMDKYGKVKESETISDTTLDKIFLFKNGVEFNYDIAEDFQTFKQSSGIITLNKNDDITISASSSNSQNNYRGISKVLNNLSGKGYVRICVRITEATGPKITIGIGSRVSNSGGNYFSFTSGKSETIQPNVSTVYSIDITGLSSTTFAIQFTGTTSQTLKISEIWIE